MLKIGHRGAPFAALENTITSFRKALAMGADGIELDVHVCKSGELIVFHDYGLDRFTNGNGLVKDKTLAELRSLVLPQNEIISILPEVLEVLGKDIYYFIELKAAEAVVKAVEMMQRYTAKGWGNLILISFIHEALKQAPLLKTGASFDRGVPIDFDKLKTLGSCMAIPHYGSLKRAHIEKAHAMGVQVVPWTVNEPVDIARMKDIGVDGIMSDYPERL